MALQIYYLCYLGFYIGCVIQVDCFAFAHVYIMGHANVTKWYVAQKVFFS